MPAFLGFFYNILILSLYAVVLSANLFTFLIAWETMAIASYLLVTIERTEKASRAGLFYAVMTHIGTAFIIVLFFLLYRATGKMDFEGMKAGIAGYACGYQVRRLRLCPDRLRHQGRTSFRSIPGSPALIPSRLPTLRH